MVHDSLSMKSTQVGVVCCKVPSDHACTNEYPGIYARLDDIVVLDFVKKTLHGDPLTGKLLLLRIFRPGGPGWSVGPGTTLDFEIY